MLKKIDPSNPVPLYQQIKQSVMAAIENGEWKKDEQIPTETELGEYFEASRTTIRQAVSELIDDRYLYRKRGVGTFVSDLKDQHKKHQDWLVTINTSDLIESKNKAYSRRILNMEEVHADKELARDIGIEAGTKLYRLVRLQYEESEPATYTITYIVPAFVPNFMEDRIKIEKGLHQYFKSCGTEIVKVDYEISAYKATRKEIIENLSVEPESANLLIRIHSYNQNEELVEFSYTFFNSERISIPVHYRYR